MQIDTGAATHVGRVRRLNEDSHLVGRAFAVVADGMGGHASGDVASRLTVSEFVALQDRDILRPEDIHDALARANASVLGEAAEHHEKSGMGTTITGIAMVDYGGSVHWMLFNVGDSRVYRFAGGRLLQMTVDHSEVAELVSAGHITPEDARRHPLRNVVTRSVGRRPAPTADVWIFPPVEGESFLLCSDGLTDELDDRAIAALLETSASATDAAEALVGAAVDAGGQDNVTAIVMRATATSTDEPRGDTTPRKKLQENL